MTAHASSFTANRASNVTIDPAVVEAIVRGTHGDPFAVLGMHGGGDRPTEIRVFAPQAAGIEVIERPTGKRVGTLARIGNEGFFAGALEGRRDRFPYRLRMTDGDHVWEVDDPYSFPLLLGDLDIYLIAEGSHRRLYEVLGAHPMTIDGIGGVRFAVWAPNAQRVSVVGDFNAWDGRRHPMRKRGEAGLWELFVPGLAQGMLYKFELLGPDGSLQPLKADPVSFSQENPPGTGSIVNGLPYTEWSDAGWMAEREQRNALSAPISVYEVHLGSWRRGDNDGYLDYDTLADQLIPYVKDLGFTHIELLPISEHPFSGSWGYQPIGLYAPTRRFGTPEAFGRFVNRCHQAGLGILLDWVPAHFPTDAHGLRRFDGTALYEHEDWRRGFHKDWNTLIYNLGRREVFNFLLANGLFWLDRYHLDGLRVDAVASMLYLDYSRQAGEWIPNEQGGNENHESIAFLRTVNTRVFADFPGATTAAEESTAWPAVSRPVEFGGLGFGYKWNMGWMHDTLDYMHEDPVHRKYHHGKMTFGLVYAFSENFILPLSHDEVVHGKGSLIGKMPGDRWQKFANLRAYYGFMWTHPGKKLLFMGCEFAQEREWNHDQSLDWHLLDGYMHAGVTKLVAALNRLYRSTPALHVKDCDPDGFGWIDESNAEQSVYVYQRKGGVHDSPVVVICNFTPMVREDYQIGVPRGGAWREVLNTDAQEYGGSGVANGSALIAEETRWHGQPYALRLTLPPLATVALMPA